MSAVSRSMDRRRDGQVRDFGPGPGYGGASPPSPANDNCASVGHRASMLPPDAWAIIEPVPLRVNQSGRAHASLWRLRFGPRWVPRADPLTGWTGGGDPLGQIELRFANRDAAELYCRRATIPFEIRGSSEVRRPAMPCLTREAPPRLCCSPIGPHALCCGDYPIGAHRETQARPDAVSHSAFSFAG